MEGAVEKEMKPMGPYARLEEETERDTKSLDWTQKQTGGEEEGGGGGRVGGGAYSDKAWTPYEDALPFRLFPGAESGYLSLRSLLSRPFEYRLSLFPYDSRGCTVFELLMATLVIALLTAEFFTFYDAYTSKVKLSNKKWKGMVSDSGTMTFLCFLFCFLLGARNSIWTYLLGVPFERQLRFHKFLAAAGMAAVGIHGGSYYVSPIVDEEERNTGLVMIGCLAGIYLTSFFLIRRYFFEFFLFSHVFFFFGFAIAG